MEIFVVSIVRTYALTLSIHLPDADAGRFEFSALVTGPDKCRYTITGRDLSRIVPDMQAYLDLHMADHNGMPHDVIGNSWYHFAGLLLPGEEYADHAAEGILIERLMRLLRTSRQQVTDIIDRLRKVQDEFSNPAITRDHMIEEVMKFSAGWKKLAERAIEALTKDATHV